MLVVTRRWLLRSLALLVICGLAFLARPVHHLLRVSWRQEPSDTPEPPGVLNDASGMSRTPVEEAMHVRDLSDLKEGLRRARTDQRAVAVAGGRLSMGGQSLATGGVVLDMTGYDLVRYREEEAVAIAGGGATWARVLAELDRHGRSPAHAPCMADATVGGSLSVNAYGWQAGQPPVAAGVRELMVMLADGALWRCSREENQDLFSAVLGGYGLFGVIVEATLETVPNRECSVDSRLVSAEDLGSALRQSHQNAAIELAVAHLSVLPATMLERAVLTEFETDRDRPSALRRWGHGWLPRTARRGAMGDPYGKWLDWQLRVRLPGLLRPGHMSRNSVFNRTVRDELRRTENTSTLLLTLMVPPEKLSAMLNQARLILASFETELLEASVCYVGTDETAVLRYAARDVCALQLMLNDSRRPAGEYRVRELSMELIERAIALGGSMFLPYRRHASHLQMVKAYGNLTHFQRLKQRFDPETLLRSNLYRAYFGS